MIGYGQPVTTTLRVTCTDGTYFDGVFAGDWQSIMSTLVQLGYISTTDVFVNRQSVARVQRLEVDSQGKVIAPAENRPAATVRPLFVVEGGKEPLAPSQSMEPGDIEAKARDMYAKASTDDSTPWGWDSITGQERDYWLDKAVRALQDGV